jgi:hypothetical protein
VVTAGERTDTKFLENLYHFIQNHEYSINTELGSALFYSLFLRKKTSYIYKTILSKKNFYFSEFGKINPEDFYIGQLKEYKMKNSFLLEREIDIEKGKKLADFELGKEFLKSKDDLKKIIGFDILPKTLTAYVLSKIIDIKYSGMRNWKNN